MDLIQLAMEHIEAEMARDMPRIMATLADEISYKIYPSGEEFTRTEEVEAFYQMLVDNVPDLHLEVKHIFQDPEKREVCVEYRFTGTHSRTVWGLPPTHKPIVYDGCVLYAFDEAGKLTREIGYFDKTEVLASISLIRDARTPLGQFWLIFPQSPWYALKAAISRLFSKRM